MADPAHEHNRRAWDDRVRRRARHTKSVLAKDLKDPLPILDPEGWLGGNVVGRRALCLASGGGLQSALLAAAGAEVTVVDLSPAMLELDQRVAAEHGFAIRIVEGSMDDLNMLAPASFNLVLQPVSTCYVGDLGAVYREVARVCAPGAVYVSQHKQPASLQAGATPASQGYVIHEPYYRRGPLPPILSSCEHREADTREYLHRWEELVGGLCRSGFVIEDAVEPRQARPSAAPGDFGHRSLYLPPYIKLKARRVGAIAGSAPVSLLWSK